MVIEIQINEDGVPVSASGMERGQAVIVHDAQGAATTWDGPATVEVMREKGLAAFWKALHDYAPGLEAPSAQDRSHLDQLAALEVSAERMIRVWLRRAE